MINSNIKSFLMAAFCCIFLAACADSGNSGDDMADMGGDDHAVAEAEPAHEMEEMEESDDDAAAGAAGAAGAAAVMADEGEDESAAADVHAVEGHAAAMATAAIELNVGEVQLPDYGWKLKWFGATEISQVPGADINLRFAVGTLAGNSGCNEYDGSYEGGAEEKSVVMGEIAATRKMCPDELMNAEQRYLGMLRSVSRYEFKKDGLYLYNAADDWLHYVPEEPEEEPEGD